MTKKDLITEAKIYWPDTDKMINAIFRAISTSMVKGEIVRIYNFGTFKPVVSKVWSGYDFLSSKPIKISGKRRVKFITCQTVEDMMNET